MGQTSLDLNQDILRSSFIDSMKPRLVLILFYVFNLPFLLLGILLFIIRKLRRQK